MAIIDDYAAIAGELRRIQAERQRAQAEAKTVVPIGVLRVPTIRYRAKTSIGRASTTSAGLERASPSP